MWTKLDPGFNGTPGGVLSPVNAFIFSERGQISFFFLTGARIVFQRLLASFLVYLLLF